MSPRSPARHRATSCPRAAAETGNVVGRCHDSRSGLPYERRPPHRPAARQRSSDARQRGTRTPCRTVRPSLARPPRESAGGALRSRAEARARRDEGGTGSARVGLRVAALPRTRGRCCGSRPRTVPRRLRPSERVRPGTGVDRGDRRSSRHASPGNARRAGRRARRSPRSRSRSRSRPRVRAVEGASSPAAIARDAPTIASACRATSRARDRSPLTSWRRWAWSAIESRRSATHRTPVSRAAAAPTRCTDPGGEVVSTTSIRCRRTIWVAAGIAVTFQRTLASGTSSWRPASSTAGAKPLQPVRRTQFLGRAARPRAEIARAMNANAGRTSRAGRLGATTSDRPARARGRRSRARRDGPRTSADAGHPRPPRGASTSRRSGSSFGRAAERDELVALVFVDGRRKEANVVGDRPGLVENEPAGAVLGQEPSLARGTRGRRD